MRRPGPMISGWRGPALAGTVFAAGLVIGATAISRFNVEAPPALVDLDRQVALMSDPARPPMPTTSEPEPLAIAPQAGPPTDPVPVPDKPPPWLLFAANAPPLGERPVIAVVIDDVGLDKRRARRVIALPGPLTLSLLTYATELPALAAAARAEGHELLVHLPMEPVSGHADPGPNALMISHDVRELLRRIDWSLARFDGFVGVSNHMGSRFTQDAPAMAVVLAELQRRGLMFLDSRTSGQTIGAAIARTIELPGAERDVFLDPDGQQSDVAGQLDQLERVAWQQGFAVGIGHPHDVTLAALADWLPQATARGLVLAPISAIAKWHIQADDLRAVARPPADDLRVTAGPRGETDGFLGGAD